MSFAYLALYTGDYLRDTRHLSCTKHGIYLLLLMHCWDSKGPVPLDEQEAAGIANCRSADEIDALRYVLEKYFIKMEDGWYNKRIQREIERANEISGKRSHAAFKRHAGRQSNAEQHASAMQVLDNCNALDTNTTPTTNTIPTPTTRKTNTRAKARCVCPEDFGKPFTPALQEWLANRGETQTKAHLIHFLGYAKANGKMYVDWEQAFKNAVRDDWAGVRKVVV